VPDQEGTDQLFDLSAIVRRWLAAEWTHSEHGDPDFNEAVAHATPMGRHDAEHVSMFRSPVI
jgi:hypothetical protein